MRVRVLIWGILHLNTIHHYNSSRKEAHDMTYHRIDLIPGIKNPQEYLGSRSLKKIPLPLMSSSVSTPSPCHPQKPDSCPASLLRLLIPKERKKGNKYPSQRPNARRQTDNHPAPHDNGGNREYMRRQAPVRSPHQRYNPHEKVEIQVPNMIRA